MNEIFEIDYNNPKEVLVSDNKNLPIEKWEKAMPVGFVKRSSGQILLVGEYNFIFTTTSYFNYWQQIPEIQTRPMTWDEALPILDKCRIRLIGECGWKLVQNILEEDLKFQVNDDWYNDFDLTKFEYVLNITDEPKRFIKIVEG